MFLFMPDDCFCIKLRVVWIFEFYLIVFEYRQADRQIEKQIDRQKDRQIDKQTDRQIDRQKHIQVKKRHRKKETAIKGKTEMLLQRNADIITNKKANKPGDRRIDLQRKRLIFSQIIRQKNIDNNIGKVLQINK